MAQGKSVWTKHAAKQFPKKQGGYPMVRHASLFSQLVALFDRQKFYQMVFRHDSERYAEKYNSWDHFVAMLFCKLAQSKSLREICGGLAYCIGKLRHLGMKNAPNKSTLSYANKHRPAKMFEERTPVKVAGRVTGSAGKLYIANPEIERVDVIPDMADESLFGKEAGGTPALYPVYPETRGVTSKWFYHAASRLIKDGALDAAEFYRPQGLCYHGGVIWVADTENHLLRKIDLKAGQVSTVAGTGAQGGYLRGGDEGRKVALSSPWDVSLKDGFLYFANAGTHQIGIYDVQLERAAQFAGSGQEAILDGPRLAAAFAQPSGLSVHNDKLYLADSETSAIRSIRLDKIGLTATYVGTGLFDFGDKDGVGKEAELQHPLGVHYADGAVFIADSYNHKIKALDLKTLEVITVEASVDLVCDDTTCTRLWEPAGVLCLNKTLYVSDTNNHRILKIDLETEKTEVFIQ